MVPPLGRDPAVDGGRIKDQWGIFQYPTVYVIDDAGVIQHKDLRGLELDEPLERMIATAEANGHKNNNENAQPDDEQQSPDTAVEVPVP
jgi:hypothetical protein